MCTGYSPLGSKILDALNNINDTNMKFMEQHPSYRYRIKKYSLNRLASAAAIDPSTLSKYVNIDPKTGVSYKRPTLHTIIRLCAALSLAGPEAVDLIHRAGYDISYDTYTEFADYREIISQANISTDDVNRILEKHGGTIDTKLKRYKAD